MIEFIIKNVLLLSEAGAMVVLGEHERKMEYGCGKQPEKV